MRWVRVRRASLHCAFGDLITTGQFALFVRRRRPGQPAFIVCERHVEQYYPDMERPPLERDGKLEAIPEGDR